MIQKELLKHTRYVAIFYVFAFITVSFYLSKLMEMLFAWFRLNDIAIFGDQFSLSTLIAVAVTGISAIVLWKKQDTKKASFEIAEELSSVDWPDKEQTKTAVFITIGFSIVFAIFLAVMDAVWSTITTFIIN